MYLAMHHGDLEANLLELEGSTEQKPAIPEEDIKEITSQILEGLKIMHAEGFAHRDLKPKVKFFNVWICTYKSSNIHILLEYFRCAERT
jgi:serine/threonine protein kinase